jgi:hypothetical protein
MRSLASQPVKKLIPTSLLRRYHAYKYARYRKGSPFAEKEIGETFDRIYRANHWDSEESVSGPGSDRGQTERIRAGLRGIIDRYGVRTLLDVPCGDFNWMRHADLRGVSYLGGDIVAALVERNRQRFGRDGVAFTRIDLTADPLPRSDLVFCRDCLVHLSYENVFKALRNIKASGSRYLLTTSFSATPVNYDIVTGDWRALNLNRAPFHLPAPIAVVEEDHAGVQAEYPDKVMMLWPVERIPDFDVPSTGALLERPARR